MSAAVLVLGHRGMLGHVVARYLRERGHAVATTEARYGGGPADPLLAAVAGSDCDWIVNAAGRIWQKDADPDALELANARLPVALGRALRPGQKLLHASTDCVFSGRRGAYRADEPPDAEDAYGASKRRGEAVAEPGRCLVLRSSMVGPELAGARGLMAWFLAQRGTVDGYTNQRWNGITTLEWARIADEIVSGATPARSAILQAGVWPPLTKFELLGLIARTWGAAAALRPAEAAEALDRSLVPQLRRPPLERQLAELRAWYLREPVRA